MSSYSWGSIDPRAEESWLKNAVDPSVVTSQGFNSYSNTSSAFVDEIKFAAAKTARTSIVVLASFNVLAALGTIFGVLFDSVVATRRDDPSFKFRYEEMGHLREPR